ncbi:MAG: hypothetical protein HY754_02045 [Nitrospirae bacterium]|nr:hypothetical protein [Nitrospirota bacterium]
MKTIERYDIDDMIHELPEKRLCEVRDFIGYLLEKEKKHKAFVKRVLKARAEPREEFKSVDALMKAIRAFKE